MILTVFYFLFSWILNFIIYFNNAFTRTLAILAALDSNLVANLGLRKYSPSFICTSAACNSTLSWWAVWGWRLKMYGNRLVGGYHYWTTKDVTDLKHWNVKILKHEKSGKPISIQVDLLCFGLGEHCSCSVTDSGYKLLLERHNNPVKKNRNFV